MTVGAQTVRIDQQFESACPRFRFNVCEARLQVAEPFVDGVVPVPPRSKELPNRHVSVIRL
jgi:hypothetical protein